MDYRDYKQLYKNLLSAYGRNEIGSDPSQQDLVVEKINEFLKKYPKVIPADKNPDANIIQLSLKEILRRTIDVSVELLNDISSAFSDKDYISSAQFRQRIFKAFTMKERRMYVGIILVFLSFILYFIDSVA